jgi:hypothetical protein
MPAGFFDPWCACFQGAMAILEKVSGGRGWLISHRGHLERLYSGEGLEPEKFFEVLTPFRMDAEAEKIAKAAEKKLQGDDDGEPPAKKQKKKMQGK